MWCVIKCILTQSVQLSLFKPITSTYTQEKIPAIISSLDPEGALCIGVDIGGLNLEDVSRHGAVRLDAHILVND